GMTAFQRLHRVPDAINFTDQFDLVFFDDLELTLPAQIRGASFKGAKLPLSGCLPAATVIIADLTGSRGEKCALDGLQVRRRHVESQFVHVSDPVTARFQHTYTVSRPPLNSPGTRRAQSG